MISIPPKEPIDPACTKGNLPLLLKAIHNSPKTAPGGECLQEEGEVIPHSQIFAPSQHLSPQYLKSEIRA